MNETILCDNQQLLNSREAAKFLAISERSLWQLAKDGLILRVRMKKSVRFAKTDLIAFVNQQKERAGVKFVPLVVAEIAREENVPASRGI